MSQEERMSASLTFPFGSFLMLRLEYVLLTGNELEAKILRLIEKRMDDERRRRYQAQMNTLPSGTKETSAVLDIPKNVWVPISHALFLYDLYGTVQSENTLKRALASLLKKQLILARKGQGRYAPTEYQLNLEKIEEEFAAMSAQGRAGYQQMIPSSNDPLHSAPGYQAVTPTEDQSVIPSSATRGSRVDPLRVSATDPKRRYREKTDSRTATGEDGLFESQAAPAHVHTDSSSSEANLGTLSAEERKMSASLPPSCVAPETPLDAEAIVRLIESKRGIPYDSVSRSRQLTAAQRLLTLSLPLTVDILERVYDECCDPWWQQHFGALHVTHLVEREKSHGELRIVRLLKRVQAKKQSFAHDAIPLSSDSGQPSRLVSSLRVGVSGLPIIQAPAQPMTVITPKCHRPYSAGRMVS